MSKRIYLSPPHLSGEELKFVHEAFESNWIAPVGPAINEFEKQLAEYNSIENCVVLSSGTAAIHIALIVLGVNSGDEVICSSFTFSGSCNPIIYQSAIPVFVDSEKESWNMDPPLLEETIKDRISLGRKPKAIIVVHLFGMPAKMEEIMSIAKKYEIPVIEDAAEALGSEYQNRKAGAIGDIGVFSFNGNKIITTSGGGALISNNKKWIERARFLSSQSRSPAPHYEHEEIGFNYQLSNISASIGLGQMKVLNERVHQRRSIFERYKQELDESIFKFQTEMIGVKSNRWLTTVHIESKNNSVSAERIREALEKENIETRPLWKPMHLQPVFKGAPSYLNGISESLFENGLCLPSGSGLTEEDLSRITSSIRLLYR
jgi:dTDP-4-amino-4,6-dideoxygalactose transaminase